MHRIMRRFSSGAWAAAILVFAGGTAACLAWWYNLSRTRHALDFWGPEAVSLIRDAPLVAAWHISFPLRGNTTADLDHALLHPETGAAADVRKVHDISRAKGLVHLRHALLDDRSFDWKNAGVEPENLHYALTFQQGDSRLVIYFSDDFSRLTTSPRGTAAHNASRPKHISTEPMAGGLKKYFSQVFGDK
jgi:hypothetical protein